MKKMLTWFMVAGMVCVTFLSGCTTVESTQKFNAINVCNTASERAVCQSHVVMTGWYLFWCIPLFVGSAAGDGKCSMFQDTLTTENVMSLLTREVKSKGATRLLNVNVESSSSTFLLILSSCQIQASGTGVRPSNLPFGATGAVSSSDIIQ